jgi:hemolysin activation/secretion protein
MRVHIHDFRFTGNTAIASDELDAVVAAYRGRELSNDDFEVIRVALTRHYIKRGFINSGAVLPDQEIKAGIITFQIIEGRISRIDVIGSRRLPESYVHDRVALDAGPPVNVYAIRDRLYLLQQDPRIRRLDAALLPGTRPGEAILRIDLDEALSQRVWFTVNNYRPPSVGAERAEVELLDYNLLGYGDTFGLRGGVTEGSDDLDLNYAIPLNARDTALQLRYARNRSAVVESPFDQLDVQSRSQTIGIGVWHFLHKAPQEEVGLGVTFEQRQSRSYLLGEPFAFSPGTPANGRVRLSALRFAQSWLTHNPDRVLSARSTFSVGVDAYDPTLNSSGEPDARFLAWLGQLQWVERLFARHDELVTRVDTQVTDDPMLSLEQFSVGGAHSVRGYRENQLVGDNGLVASMEYRLSLWSDPGRGHRVQLAGFFDWGRSWNRERPTPEPEVLASIGAGLRATYYPWLDFELYYGSRLKKVAEQNNDLQDRGVHFQLRARVW